MNEYQQLALRTARDKNAKDEIFHLIMGLCGETGELAEKFKKIVRDNQSDFSQIDKDLVVKELGDILWYLAVLAHYFDTPLEEVAQTNIAKLASRQARGKINGSGDNR